MAGSECSAVKSKPTKPSSAARLATCTHRRALPRSAAPAQKTRPPLWESWSAGNIHTNGLENFWSLLKRGLNGTYVSVEPFLLFRYLDEQSFRYNNRKDVDDYGRFMLALSQITGKRLTYEHLTGKDRADSQEPAPTVN